MSVDEQIRVISPIDGDMLNERDGHIVDGCLEIEVTISAPEGYRILVNRTGALYKVEIYSAKVLLSEYSNSIEVFDICSGFRRAMTVY
jgi:hypothetical protein